MNGEMMEGAGAVTVGPPGRRVRVKPVMRRRMAAAAVLAGVSALLGGALFLYTLNATCVALFGQVVPGWARYTHVDIRKTPYLLAEITYEVDGQTYAASAPVSTADYARLRRGGPVEAKVLPFEPLSNPQIVSSVASVTPSFWTYWAVAIWVNGLIIAVTAGLRGERKLYRDGLSAAGVVTKVLPGFLPVVEYEFTAPGDAWTVTGRSRVGDAQIGPGDRLTILYQANRPSRSVAYELGRYEVDGATSY